LKEHNLPVSLTNAVKHNPTTALRMWKYLNRNPIMSLCFGSEVLRGMWDVQCEFDEIWT